VVVCLVLALIYCKCGSSRSSITFNPAIAQNVALHSQAANNAWQNNPSNPQSYNYTGPVSYPGY
jgi:hypothetical protein